LAAETFVTALLLITAIISAGILINAVYPVVWNMAGTFSSASHETDTRMRTDFKIVTTYAIHGTPEPHPNIQIWMKNIGTSRIGIPEIDKADVIIGLTGNMARAQLISGVRTTPTPPTPSIPSLSDGKWTYNLFDDNDNAFWDSGETLEIDAYNLQLGSFSTSGNLVSFQFVLPNGVWRSSEFTSS
jgi:flagellar protein FlaG